MRLRAAAPGEGQQQRPVGLDAACREQIELSDLSDPQARARPLVGERRVDEAVEQDPAARRQRRDQRLLDQLGAGRRVQQRLGASADRQRRIGDQRPDALGRLDAARLAQLLDVDPALAQRHLQSRWRGCVLPAPSTPSIVISRPPSDIVADGTRVCGRRASSRDRDLPRH